MMAEAVQQIDNDDQQKQPPGVVEGLTGALKETVELQAAPGKSLGASGILDTSSRPFSSGPAIARADERVGLFDDRTLGESMEESLAQQRTGLDMQGFENAVASGQITGVADADAGKLNRMFAIVNDPKHDEAFRTSISQDIQKYLDIHNSGVAIGPKTVYGDAEGFKPTVTEEEDPKLYKKQEAVYEAQRMIYGAVAGKFDGIPGLLPEDRDILEETLTQMISTGSFTDSFQESVNENVLRGTFIYGERMFTYGLNAAIAASEYAVRGGAQIPLFFGGRAGLPYEELAEIWRKDEPTRNKIRDNWRGFLATQTGIRFLSEEMEDQLRFRLEQRLADDPERLNRILNPALLTAEGQEFLDPSGNVVRGRRQLVNEDTAQEIFNASLETITEFEQYGVALLDTAFMLFGTTKAQLAFDAKELKRVRGIIDAEIAKGGKLAARLKGRPLGQQALIMQQQQKAIKFNKNAVANALELEAAAGGIQRLRDGISNLNTELDLRRSLNGKKLTEDMPKSGFKSGEIYSFADDLEIATLEAKRDSLMTQHFRSKILMDGMPILKTTLVQALPLSAAQYIAGETLTGLTGDRLTAQGLGALAYIFAGPTIFKTAGRIGGGINSYFGNPAASVGMAIEGVANMGARLAQLDPNFFTGVIVDADMVKYRKLIESDPTRRRPGAKFGGNLTYQERKSLQFLKRLSTTLDDDGRAAVMQSLETYSKLQARIVNSFEEGSDARDQAEVAFRETFATMSNMGWMRSAAMLATSKVSANALQSERGVIEADAMQTLQRKSLDQAKLGIENLERLLKENVVDPADKTFLEDYIQTLKETARKETAALAESDAELSRKIEDLIDISTSDSFQEVSQETLDRFVAAGVRVNKRLKSDLDEAAYRNDQRARINKGLAVRAEALKKFRKDDITDRSTRHLEYVINNGVATFKGRARVGFTALDKKAAAENKTINIGPMIQELFKFAKDDPDGNATLSTFFSPEGMFFRGPMGRRVEEVFENMAGRWAESLGEEAFDAMMQNASLKTIDGKENPAYIENVSPLKLLMYHMDKSGFTGFQASPGEVMDVYAAFRDYSIGMKNGRLASQYRAYEGKVLDIVKTQAGEYYDEWQKAADLYKTEWFDRFQRMDGPGSKFLRSQKFGALGPKPRKAADGTIDIPQPKPEEPDESDFVRLFRFGYGTVDPDTLLRPLSTKINAALRNPGEENFAPLRSEVRRLIGEFANKNERGELFFDAADENSMAMYGALSTALREFVYDKWARKTIDIYESEKGLDQVVEFLPSTMRGMKEVESLMKVRLVNSDKADFVTLVDFEGMISESRKLETLIDTDDKAKQLATKAATRIQNEITRQEKVIQRVTAIGDRGLDAVNEASGIRDGAAFLKRYFETGDTRDLEALRIRARLNLSGGDLNKKTITIDRPNGESFEADIDEVIDKGISQLLIDGLLEKGKLRVIAGEVKDDAEAIQTFQAPGELAKFLEDERVFESLSGFLGADHVQGIKDLAQYMNMKSDSVFAKYDQTINNIVSGFGTNQFISRAFNIRRGMVSPQYVAAELAVAMASKAGVDLLKLAATSEDGALLMHRFMEFPEDMTKADIDNLSARIITFVTTEFGALGLEAADYFYPSLSSELGIEVDEETLIEAQDILTGAKSEETTE
jgi:hypothetical protein